MAVVAEFNGGSWFRSFERQASSAERDAGVLTAEPEGVRERERHVEVARLVRRDVEVAVGVGRLVVDRRRDPAGRDRERAHGALDRAGRAEHVAGHRLGRADAHRAGVLAERGLDRDGLGRVVQLAWTCRAR